jgi:hypothetical protein
LTEPERAPARRRRIHGPPGAWRGAHRGAAESASGEGRVAAAFVALVVIFTVAMVAIMATVANFAQPRQLAFITPGQRVAAATSTVPRF